jgi:mRNA interferase MazF
MAPMKKGEIWRVHLPLAPGHAQAGDRPAIIVQNDAVIASLPTVLIVPLTGRLAASRFDGTLVIQPDSQNGLTMPSVALAFQLRAIDRRDFLQCLGMLDKQTLDQVLALIQTLVQ